MWPVNWPGENQKGKSGGSLSWNSAWILGAEEPGWEHPLLSWSPPSRPPPLLLCRSWGTLGQVLVWRTGWAGRGHEALKALPVLRAWFTHRLLWRPCLTSCPLSPHSLCRGCDLVSQLFYTPHPPPPPPAGDKHSYQPHAKQALRFGLAPRRSRHHPQPRVKKPKPKEPPLLAQDQRVVHAGTGGHQAGPVLTVLCPPVLSWGSQPGRDQEGFLGTTYRNITV